MEQANSVICICETHEQVQRAMYNLQEAAIDMRMLSIATRDTSSDPHDLNYYNVGDESFAIPGFGFLLVSGPLASWIAAAFCKDSGGLSVVSVTLATLGIPPESIVQYETALQTDKYVLVVHGSSENDCARALRRRGTGRQHIPHRELPRVS